MATIYRFKYLEIWQLARKLYHKTSKLVDKLKKNNDFRFAGQMKAAADSIMDNIAESFERNSLLEFLNSLSVAKGKCGEFKSQFYRCFGNCYILREEFD